MICGMIFKPKLIYGKFGQSKLRPQPGFPGNVEGGPIQKRAVSDSRTPFDLNIKGLSKTDGKGER